MTLKSGKVWGETRPILQTKVFELHHIRFKNGYKCSEHKHKTKFNAFLCLKGVLLIRVWKNDYDLVDETVLSDEQITVVPPGEFHQFEALSDGEALELYWAEFDKNDIERRDVGGEAAAKADATNRLAEHTARGESNVLNFTQFPE